MAEPDSEYVGFLVFRRGNGCLFTCGRGELSLPYSWSDANRTDTLAAFMVPEADAVVFQALWHQSNYAWEDQNPSLYGYPRSITGSGCSYYNLVTRAVPCRLISENKAGNYSVWGIDEFYMGYLQGFEFEFAYNAAIREEISSMTEEELAALETEAFYKANGLISGWSKDYNRQVYNSTLHDIQLQIKYEAIKAEHLKKSFQDPSGYVYEAVPEDVIEGVTATLYYSETEEGPYSVWADPFGEQPNPQSTSDTGNYMWMVPIGWWKVRYEKDGYRIAESVAMPVPPIHTAVNIGLLSEEAPALRVVPGDGEIMVLFSKYMQLESLLRLFGDEEYTDERFDGSAFAVQFYDADGVSVPGAVSFPDVRENTGYKGGGYGTDVIDSDWFVRCAVFTPDDPALDLSGVTWKLSDGMASYAGVALDGETASRRGPASVPSAPPPPAPAPRW